MEKLSLRSCGRKSIDQSFKHFNMPILRMPDIKNDHFVKSFTSSTPMLFLWKWKNGDVSETCFFPRHGMSRYICWRVPATFPDSLPPASHNQRHAAKRARNLREGLSSTSLNGCIFGAANVKFPKNVTRISASLT